MEFVGIFSGIRRGWETINREATCNNAQVPPVRGNRLGRQFFLQASVLAYFLNPLSMPCLLLAGCVYRGLGLREEQGTTKTCVLPKEGLHSPMVENPSKMSVRKKPYPNGCHEQVYQLLCVLEPFYHWRCHVIVFTAPARRRKPKFGCADCMSEGWSV